MLERLYDKDQAQRIWPELERLLRVYRAYRTPAMDEARADFDPAERFSEKDSVLITYGDLIVRQGEPPLSVLAQALERHASAVNTVHILPFFPYSSDRGFSVTSYHQVNPQLGTWGDVEWLSQRYKLMFDGVFNHISSEHRWFQEFLDGNPRYERFFTAFTTQDAIAPDHLKLILRPRASELLTRYDTVDGARWVWTTFSPDQIDLDFGHPMVLMRVIKALLHYVRRGADLIRIDAATYLWCELGTSCAHLEETHLIVKLMRAVLDVVAPQVALVTETNVPHEDNITYFGSGTDEAQMVYNFALPPLVLLTFQTGDSGHLTRWAATLEPISNEATYFNFLDSHDGIGLLPIQNLVPEKDRLAMVERVVAGGGRISYRRDSEGNSSPYELNTTWWSALNPRKKHESLDRKVDRFLASRAIALSIMGVPGIYFASMIGSSNDLKAIRAGGENRSINRAAVDADRLDKLLSDPRSRSARCFRGINRLLEVRCGEPAFHPNAEQIVLELVPQVFALIRHRPEAGRTVLALIEVSGEAQEVRIDGRHLERFAAGAWRDLLGDRTLEAAGDAFEVHLDAYDVGWFAAES